MTQLLSCLVAQFHEVVRHLNKIQIIADVLMHFITLLHNVGHVLALHLMMYKLLYVLLAFPLSFYFEVGEILSSVDPVSNCSLYLEHYWYQYFLYHF